MSAQERSLKFLCSDVFMVRGEIKMNALMTITRNMAIVRHAGELTLVDPIRISPAGAGRVEDPRAPSLEDSQG